MKTRNFANFILFLSAIVVKNADADYLRKAGNESDVATSPSPRPEASLPDEATIYKWLSEHKHTAQNGAPNIPSTPTAPSNITHAPSAQPRQDDNGGGKGFITIIGGIIAGGAITISAIITIVVLIINNLKLKRQRTYFDKLVKSIVNGSFTGEEINLSHLNLGPNKLNDEDIEQLTSELNNRPYIRDRIKKINLSNNRLKTSLDASIFPNLIYLSLRHNELTFGPVISKSQNLEELFIRNNNLTVASEIALTKLREQNARLIIHYDRSYAQLSRKHLIQHFQKDAREYFSSEEFMQKVLWCNKFANIMKFIEQHVPQDIVIKILTEYMTNVRKGYENRVILQTRFFRSAFAQGSPEHAILENYITKDLKITLAHASAHIEKIIDNIFKINSVPAKAMQRLSGHFKMEVGFNTTQDAMPLAKPPVRSRGSRPN